MGAGSARAGAGVAVPGHGGTVARRDGKNHGHGGGGVRSKCGGLGNGGRRNEPGRAGGVVEGTGNEHRAIGGGFAPDGRGYRLPVVVSALTHCWLLLLGGGVGFPAKFATAVIFYQTWQRASKEKWGNEAGWTHFSFLPSVGAAPNPKPERRQKPRLKTLDP